MKVFISHSSRDKKFVRSLKDGLIENNIDIWFDEDQLDLGDSLLNKLGTALNTSSHLVIILSPSSIESDWVKFELKKALENQRTGLMQKIIPVKFRECDVPEELADVLYADLSNEIVLPDGDRLKFLSGGFENFFVKLVTALRNSAKAISTNEKEEIIKSIKSTESTVNTHVKNIHRANYEVVGFNTTESRLKYQRLIAKALNFKGETDDIRPFLLPASLMHIFQPEIGEKIKFESDLPFPSHGHFAGYRIDDLKITVDKRTRDEILLQSKQIYQTEIDPEKKTIRFVNNFDYLTKGSTFFSAGENNYALAG
jgi:hypothetical protein